MAKNREDEMQKVFFGLLVVASAFAPVSAASAQNAENMNRNNNRNACIYAGQGYAAGSVVSVSGYFIRCDDDFTWKGNSQPMAEPGVVCYYNDTRYSPGAFLKQDDGATRRCTGYGDWENAS